MYILDEKHNPVVEEDVHKWGEFIQDIKNKVVKKTEIYHHGNIEVSTVFLGLNHNFSREGRPILFETMIFGGLLDQHQWRYCTWEDALIGHENACLLVKNLMKGGDTNE